MRWLLPILLLLLSVSANAASPAIRVGADDVRAMIKDVATGKLSPEDMARKIGGETVPLFVAKPETIRKPLWLLDPDKTLRDNLATWADSAGYALEWAASNYFAVTKRAQIEGELQEVLRLIEMSTGLTVEMDMRAKTIAIRDPQKH